LDHGLIIGVVNEPEIRIRPVNEGDRPMLSWLVAELWGSELVAVHGSVLRPAELPGFIAERSRRVVGLLHLPGAGWRARDRHAQRHRAPAGIGTMLIEAANGRGAALPLPRGPAHHHQRQRRRAPVLPAPRVPAGRTETGRGFDRSRLEKPQIPRTGDYGIPLHDEIDLTLRV